MHRRRLIALAALALAAVPPARALAGEGTEAKRRTGDVSYIALATLTAFTIRPNGRRGVMSVDCGLDVPDPSLRARAELVLPRLRAAFVETVPI